MIPGDLGMGQEGYRNDTRGPWNGTGRLQE